MYIRNKQIQISMRWKEMNEAVLDAKQTMKMADLAAEDMVKMLVGRL